MHLRNRVTVDTGNGAYARVCVYARLRESRNFSALSFLVSQSEIYKGNFFQLSRDFSKHFEVVLRDVEFRGELP